MVAVAIVGILAGTAIPAFIKYIRKSKTAEARQNIRKIYEGARQYYLDPHVSSVTGFQPLPPQFPEDAPRTPPSASLACCAGSGTNEKCEPEPTQWETDEWRALHFSMPDPHYYAYEYQYAPGGFGLDHTFVITVHGNLDCDTTYSQFMMSGAADPVFGDGPVGTAKIHRIRELE
jgi:type IV pilus assembly protein PilA